LRFGPWEDIRGFEQMDKIIHLSTTLECDSAKAFELFTKNEYLEKWLTEKAEVIPEAGGKYELFWRPEDRESDSTIGCKILIFHPPDLISFEWKGPKQFKHFMNDVRPLTNVTVSFFSKEKETEVHLLHMGWKDTEEWEKAWQWFQTAWKNAFERLRECAIGLQEE
jgi:uncharacterized protein YndB with AHSA1/START domain